jgi:hypothetical protein
MNHHAFAAVRDCDHRHLDQRAGQDQIGNDGRPHWRILGPERPIHLVHRGKVFSLGQVDVDRGDVGQARARLLQHRGDVLDGLAGLRPDIAFGRHRPGDVDEAVGFDCGAEWQIRHRTRKRLTRLCGSDHAEQRDTDKHGPDYSHGYPQAKVRSSQVTSSRPGQPLALRTT